MKFRTWFLFLSLVLCKTALAAPTCSLLIVGDSLSAGYGLSPGTSWVNLLEKRVQQTAPRWKVVNASVSGDTTQNGVQRLKPALQRHQPQAVLIELGGNDALRGIPPQNIRSNLQTMINQAQAQNAWVGLIEVPVLPNYGPRYASALQQLYTDVAQKEGVARIPCFVCGVALQPNLMQADRVHPNEKAQEAMLDVVWPQIKTMLQNRKYTEKCR